MIVADCSSSRLLSRSYRAKQVRKAFSGESAQSLRWANIGTAPFDYYYQHVAPNETKRDASWSDDERAVLTYLLAAHSEAQHIDFGVIGFLMPMRSGRQCELEYARMGGADAVERFDIGEFYRALSLRSATQTHGAEVAAVSSAPGSKRVRLERPDPSRTEAAAQSTLIQDKSRDAAKMRAPSPTPPTQRTQTQTQQKRRPPSPSPSPPLSPPQPPLPRTAPSHFASVPFVVIGRPSALASLTCPTLSRCPSSLSSYERELASAEVEYRLRLKRLRQTHNDDWRHGGADLSAAQVNGKSVSAQSAIIQEYVLRVQTASAMQSQSF